MHRFRTIALTMLAFVANAPISQASPCTAQIDQIQRQIAQVHARRSTAGDASGRQSLGAQLHHQPTPATVESAEDKANADATAALDRARIADAAGDARGCAQALNQAKLIYGLQ